MNVRAKFRCASKTLNAGEAILYTFNAVTRDGVPENERYHKYTPYGELKLSVDNPAVSFEIGQSYYLDFTAVEPAPAE